GGENGSADRSDRPGYSEEMRLVNPHQELCVVVQAYEGELDTALGEAETRKGHVQRRQQREDRERQGDEHRRQDEHRPCDTVEAGGDRAPLRSDRNRARRGFVTHREGEFLIGSLQEAPSRRRGARPALGSGPRAAYLPPVYLVTFKLAL